MDAAPAPTAAHDGDRLLALVTELVRELRPQLSPARRFSLDDRLDRDLGLDSLARVELVVRIERCFGVRLGETAFADAETPRDLLHLLGGSAAAQAVSTPVGRPAVSAPEDDSPLPAPPTSLATLVEALDWHAARHPQRISVTLSGEASERPEGQVAISYAELRADALAVASGLAASGRLPGERIAIMLPTGRDFLAAFYGALYAGCVPVPIYPPVRLSQIEDHLRRIAAIVASAGASALITVDRAKPLAHLLRAQGDTLREVVTATDLAQAGAGKAAPAVRIAATDLAFLQYTSGSTGNPKGVALTHANLLANLRAMGRAAAVAADDIFVSWLPLYHDMGLIGACLGSMFFGFHLVLMSPLSFLARPVSWLRAISDHRATLSAAPNFAYELCATKLADADLAGLDLGNWRLAFNGAEPVGVATLERFAARFAASGLRAEALTPVYGLAESSVGLAFPPLGRGPRIDRIDRRRLIEDGRAEAVVPGTGRTDTALAVVACGLPLPGHEIRIADPDGRELPERCQGRVQFRGPSSTAGYYGNPEANARLLEGDWLNTGDLGYLAGGELFITGREKDIIIRGGHNIHPQELEVAVNRIAGVRKGGVAVFPASDPATGSERLIVLAETDLRDAAGRNRIIDEIANLAVALTGGPPDDVVLAAPRTVRKTSSGKIRRAACRELYERGQLGRAAVPPWRQFASLGLDAARGQWSRWRRALGEGLWSVWAWTVFLGTALPVAFLILTVPGVGRRRRICRHAARLALALAGLTPRISGSAAGADGMPVVFVSNHASYIDALVLAAALPADPCYIGKRELADAFVVGALLSRLGCAFVERFDAARGVEHARDIEARLRAGESMLFFAEGTFGRNPGLRPFRQGAFIVAAGAGCPVVPVSLSGTRSLLRDGQWRPRHGPLAVDIGDPIRPTGNDWQAAIRLRDAARTRILATVGEPDLAD